METKLSTAYDTKACSDINFSPVKRGHQGLYKCSAVNAIGSIDNNANLIVQCKYKI